MTKQDENFLLEKYKGEKMAQDEKFLPKKVDVPISLPDIWHPEKAVERINDLTAIAKPAVESIVIDFWIAHEKLVTKKIKGWTWTRFCKETGYSVQTPINWFQKYNLPYTQTAGPKSKKLDSPKPTKKQTKPKDKSVLNEALSIIKQDKASNEDIIMVKRVCDAAIPKKKKRPKKTTLEVIHNQLNSAANDLLAFLDSGIGPQGTDLDYFTGIKAQAPLLIMCFIQMGVNIDEVVRMAKMQKGVNHGKATIEKKQIEAR